MKTLVLCCLTLIIYVIGFNRTGSAKEKPNVVLILVDDLGIEGFSCYGSKIPTPHVDALAEKGVLVTNCYAQPNCTPTRTKLMTGMRNYKSYDLFGYLNPRHKTIGNLMQQAGYKTCIAGKWQLNGNPKMSGYLEAHNNINRATQAGFDSYHLHNFIESQHSRYANSVVESNGNKVKGEYGPDMHRDFVFDFIKENKDAPFFAYYSMVLVHAAYTKTPDSFDWGKSTKRKSNEYLVDMVKYTDKIVGEIVTLLKKEGVYENTVIIFTADNGTGRGGAIETVNGIVRGGKGTLTDAGTHVPLIVHYPPKTKHKSTWKGLIDFSDFYPTLAEIAGVDISDEKELDGRSFFPLVNGQADTHKSREILFMQQDARRDDNAIRIKQDSESRNRFARTIEYKLYQTGEFYLEKEDRLEKNPLSYDQLDKDQKKIFKKLKRELDDVNQKYPWEEEWNPVFSK